MKYLSGQGFSVENQLFYFDKMVHFSHEKKPYPRFVATALVIPVICLS